MKKIFFLFALSLALLSCTSQNSVAKDNTQKSEIKPEKNEDGEWDLDVLDTDYNYFLNAVARPMSMYTESYLKSRNQFLVNEWNAYYMSGRYRNIIESSIDYNPNENYGLKFEYKLYQVFVYVQWKYKLRMQGLSGADVLR
ncbi:hypothetical protein GCM10010992_10630 [Cloacibacterium rupense]|uniref:Lipoprotein n=1 Tax=Cloacibacterium rupense TaxID=517423 RepID=A0ABQ2NJX8_9FLAO|nr:DUF6146 family protein [Cloacibacterium rupense]GGP03196.1 hypothetical protein GCM10010992_10630 [Cloacibacterium rupense]